MCGAHIMFLIVGTDVLDCPNRTAAGASPRPTKEVARICQNEIIRFKIKRLLLRKTTIGQSGTPVPTVRKQAFLFSHPQKTLIGATRQVF